MNDLIVRIAEQRDVAALADLYVELHAFHVEHLPDRLRIGDAAPNRPDPALEQGIRRMLADADSAIFVAEIDGQVVGLAEVLVREPEPNLLRVTRRYAHVQSLAVARHFRRLGIGARLIEAAQHWAEERGAAEMQLDLWEFAAGPLPFYEALGYRTLRRTMVKALKE
jgi:GNAT superfamily N-acetyltransferase